MEYGQFVLSIAGRDVNRLFVVFDVIDDNYVMIADGMLRSINKPKKKKLKHLKAMPDLGMLDITQVRSDKALAKVIKAASKSYRENQEGLFCQKMM